MGNQKLSNAPKSRIDARKFLASINKGYGGQLKLVESRIRRLAKEMDAELALTSYNYKTVTFEDVENNVFYKADVSKSNRSLQLENVVRLEIVDQEKPVVFKQACKDLVESIEHSLGNNDLSKAEKAFSKIEVGNCSPYAICNGVSVTRDGVTHKVTVSDGNAVSEDVFPGMVKVLKEAIQQSDVVISEGSILIGADKKELPVSALTRKRVIARHMRTVAENAHSSVNFKRLVKGVAGHVSNNDTRSAISLCKDFLSEEQEFCMLDKKGMMSLVENALYSQGIWNYHAVKNTAVLMWETNCHVNKGDILKEWSSAVEVSGSEDLKENFEVLKASSVKNPRAFSDTYSAFVASLFTEDLSSKAIKAKAYLGMLKDLKQVTTGSDADKAVNEAIDDLIMRLESDPNNVDDATMFETEELFSSVSTDLMDDTATLSDFDTIPEPEAVDQFGTEEDIGDFEGDMGGIDALGEDEAAMEFGGEEPALGDMGIEEPAPEGGDDLDMLDLAHVINTAKPISEMTSDDIKVVLEALKNIKPETVEVEDDEFKRLLKKGLTEDQETFVRDVMKHSQDVDVDLFEGITNAYYDLVLAEGVADEPAEDRYNVEVGDVAVNEDFEGFSKDEETDAEDQDEDDAIEECGMSESKEEDEDDDEEHIDESAEGNMKNLEGGKEGDRDGDYDDNDPDSVNESMAIVADDDEALMDLIAQVLDAENEAGEEGDEEPEVHGSGPDVHDGEGEGDEIIMDQEGDEEGHDEEDDEPVVEDNNITDPDKKPYTSEAEADKHGDGTKINDKPKFSDEDYDGSGGAKTGKDKPGSGHPSTSK